MDAPNFRTLFRVDPGAYRLARKALSKAHPQALALIESGKADYARLQGLTRLAMLVATTVWRRESDPDCCPRCGLALVEPPTAAEMMALEE